ncbi:MAG: hypothetical protein AAGF23_16410, partial [Acidobacteriota bacterium]
MTVMEFDPLPPKNPVPKKTPEEAASSGSAPDGDSTGVDGSSARGRGGAAPRIDPLAAGGGSSGAVPPALGSGAVAGGGG